MNFIHNIFNPPSRGITEADRRKILEQLGERYIHDTSETMAHDPFNPQPNRPRYSNGVDFGLKR